MTLYWAEVHAEYIRNRYLKEAAVARLVKQARQARRPGRGCALQPGQPVQAVQVRLDRRFAIWAGIRLVRLGELLLALGTRPATISTSEPAW